MYDLCIIGAGPGGYVSAIRASQLGLKVCLIEKENLGGVCLNKGCIPTKALLHSVKILKEMKYSEEFGITFKERPTINLKKMIESSRDVVSKLNNGIKYLIQKNKIDCVLGAAKFLNKNEIEVSLIDKEDEKQNIKAKNFIIATGASAKNIPNLEFNEDLICSAKGAMLKENIPNSIVIIGGGVIGVEFASFYSALGVKILILEATNSILSTEDKEIRDRMMKILKKDNIEILTNCFVDKIEEAKDKKTVKIQYKENENLKSITADFCIISIGIKPNTANLGIESIGIKLNKYNFIEVDEHCKTNIDNIYAIGDVTNKTPWLAHKASHEGIFVAEQIAKRTNHKINYNNIPSCIYSYPQVASIGLNEEKVKEMNLDYKIGKFNAEGCGKAIASKDEDAFVKIIFEKNTGEILGCHIISNDASEMIHSISIAKNSELTNLDIIESIFPHPSISEMIHEATLDADKIGIHI